MFHIMSLSHTHTHNTYLCAHTHTHTYNAHITDNAVLETGRYMPVYHTPEILSVLECHTSSYQYIPAVPKLCIATPFEDSEVRKKLKKLKIDKRFQSSL
jgi:hypothetical protein